MPLFIVFLLGMILAFSAVAPVHSQPAQGDWVVMGIEEVENKAITLNGNLMVKSGGSLTLRGVTLIVNSRYLGQYQISAEPGSSLYVYNSMIKPADERYGPVITVAGAKFVMKQSKLQGSTGGERGEWFNLREANNLIIENNTITIFGGTEGLQSSIVLRDSRNAVIKNNVIGPEGKVDFDLFLGNLHNTTVTGNNLVLNNFILEGSWDSYIANNNVGLKRWSMDVSGLVLRWGCGNNVVDNNTFSSMYDNPLCTVFRLINTPFPNAFVNNVIKGGLPKGGKGFKTCVLISQSSNAIVANNSFTEFPIGEHYLNEAIQIYRSDNNLILNNYINSDNSGIILFASSNNTLKGNHVLKSGRGIGLYYSSDNNIVENNTLENNLINMIFDDAQNNTIRTNSFSTLERQGYDDSNNFWSRNYWSDYSGKDRGDGIGNAPYTISPKGMDNAPLMSRPLLTPVLVPTLKPASFGGILPGWKTELIQDNRTLKDQVITLTGSITIKKGASLTLENVTLIAAPSKNIYMHRFYVEPGASLHIYRSKIIGAEKGPAIKFDVEKGAKFAVKDSELHNLGDPYTQEGPAIAVWGADGVVIENNIFVGSKQVILVFPNSPNTRIVNNTISKCLFGIFILQGEKDTLMNNRISEVAHKSLWVESGSSNVIVVGNKISDVWGYLGWKGLSNSIVENNTILNYMGGFPGKLGVEISEKPTPTPTLTPTLTPTTTPTPSPTSTPTPMSPSAPEISSLVIAVIVIVVAVVVGVTYILRKRK